MAMASKEARFFAWLCKRPETSKRDIENMARILLGLPELEQVEDGGEGSGNFDHLGNPGNVGGSGPGGSYRESGKANCTPKLRNKLL